MMFSALLAPHGTGSSMYTFAEITKVFDSQISRPQLKNVCSYFFMISRVRSTTFSASAGSSLSLGILPRLDMKHASALPIKELESRWAVVTTPGVCAMATPATNMSTRALCRPSCAHFPQHLPAPLVVFRLAGPDQAWETDARLLLFLDKGWWGKVEVASQ